MIVCKKHFVVLTTTGHWLGRKLSLFQDTLCFILRTPKLYSPSTYYKHLKKGAHQSQFWADKKWAGFWQISLYIESRCTIRIFHFSGFWVEKQFRLTWNSGLKYRFLFFYFSFAWIKYRLICQKPAHFVSAQMALVTTFV